MWRKIHSSLPQVVTGCNPQHNTLNLHYRSGPPSLWSAAPHIQYQWSQRTRALCCTWFSLPAFVCSFGLFRVFPALMEQRKELCWDTQRGAACSNQNATVCCCATEKCYGEPCFYCLIYFSRWWVGPMGVSGLNPSAVAMWSAHFKLNLNVRSILNDTKLSPSRSVSVGHVLFLHDSTWKAKDDPVSICLCSGSIIAAFPLESSTYE